MVFSPKRFKSISLTTLYFLSSSLFPAASFAQVGKTSSKEALTRFIKYTEADTKPQTIGQFYNKSKGVLKLQYQEAFAKWLEKNKNEPLPKLVINFEKTKKGEEHLELRFGDSKKESLRVISDSKGHRFEIGNQKLSMSDLAEATPALDKLGYKGLYKTVVPSYGTYLKMTEENQVLYFSKLHDLLLVANKVQSQFANKKKGSSNRAFLQPLPQFFISTASAEKMPGPEETAATRRCYLESGFISVEVKSKCQPSIPGFLRTLTKKCEETGKMPCNPLFYGLQNGEVNCSGGPITGDAKSSCGPLRKSPEDFQVVTQKILELTNSKNKDVLKKGQKLDEASFKGLKEEILDPMQSYIEEAVTICQSKPDHNNCEELVTNRVAFANWLDSLNPDPSKAAPEAEKNWFKKNTPLLLAGGAGILAGLFFSKKEEKTVIYQCNPGFEASPVNFNGTRLCVPSTRLYPLPYQPGCGTCCENFGPIVAHTVSDPGSSSTRCVKPEPLPPVEDVPGKLPIYKPPGTVQEVNPPANSR